MKNITIIDCNLGNRASISNMLKKLGINNRISRDKADILYSSLIILPGVGAFDAFMQALTSYDLIATLNEAVRERKIPILGICLGMQVLFEKSEEGDMNGLGLITGEVKALSNLLNNHIKTLNIGWRHTEPTPGSFLPCASHYYFAHSYYCVPLQSDDIAGTMLINDTRIPVALRRGHIYGVQFHPEKSHNYGMKFFKKFLSYVAH